MVAHKVWTELLEREPLPSGSTPKAARSSKIPPLESHQQLWAAIDNASAPNLLRAIEAGASITHRRAGRTPVHEAVHRGNRDLLAILLDAGATINGLTQSRDSLVGLIVHRDDPAELDYLIGLGFDLTTHSTQVLTEVGCSPKSPRLAGHVLNLLGPQALGNTWTGRNTDGDEMKRWCRLALRQGPAMMEEVSQAMGLKHRRADALATQFDALTYDIWETVLDSDDVDLAKRCIRAGWGPPSYANRSHNFPIHALGKRAYRIFTWSMQHPAIKASAWEAPAATLFSHIHNFGPDQLQHGIEHGLPLNLVGDEGQTLAHASLDYYAVTKGTIEWWCRHHPEALLATTAQGQTPIDVIQEPKIKAWAQQLLLKIQTGTPSPEGSRAPKRRL
jgi:hypothetical protein